jgi:aminopeptidase N
MKKFSFLFALIIGIWSCSPGKKSTTSQTAVNAPMEQVVLPEQTIIIPERAPYNASRKKDFDLVHTRLDVRFDIPKAHLIGKATISLTPHFYSTSTLALDAKGMELSKVALWLNDEDSKNLKYVYDGQVIDIELGKQYTRKDTFKVVIEYIAKPDEREEGGSSAITSDKGLYFINPQGTDPKKPVQIWTQGETEANSVWFPTIDSPNQKMSQELYITVPEKFTTLSNGLLMFSLENGDGTRTDCWKQELPHAPYLTMMAIGEYAVVKDKWRNLEVDYYVEKEYEPYAKAIFGNTPEMLEFFSKVLGVTYPWDKYHQVVVRDYVSGAMENTGAVIFGEFMNLTHRELLDGDNESIIAHELFHHWFGDLVTCESWANLPLNESFATYGEYLWIEHKYGREAADHHLRGNLSSYLGESEGKQVNMIRFDYEDKEDMFDSHSYAKGGTILHMLRKYVGDEAFFESLKYYLNKHKFSTVEIHDLRLAFEKVTGEDLNWFFNQWFLSSGHPQLVISTSYDEETKEAVVNLEQIQDFSSTPLYYLPIDVDVHVDGKVQRHRINFQSDKEEFRLPAARKPDVIIVDAEKMLLCTKKETKTQEEWSYQYNNSPLFLDRMEALENLAKEFGQVPEETIFKALNDPYHQIRITALKNIGKILKDPYPVKDKLVELVSNDPKSDVRASAIKYLAANFKKAPGNLDLFKKSMNDSSYVVLGEALAAIAVENEKEALNMASGYENEKNTRVLFAVSGIYAKSGDDSHNAFFKKANEEITGYNKYAFLNLYGRYLKNRSDGTISEGLVLLEDAAINSSAWWIRMAGLQSIIELHNLYDTRAKQHKESLTAAKTAEEKKEADEKFKSAENQKERIKQTILRIKEKETNENVQRLLGGF